MIRRRSRVRSRLSHRRDSSRYAPNESPLERLLIETSERVVKADSAMSEVLADVRKDDRSGGGGYEVRTRRGVAYLERLLTEAFRYVKRADEKARGFR
jgi:hypothetical protein